MWKETWGCQSKGKRTEFPGSWKHSIKKKLFWRRPNFFSLEMDRKGTRRWRKRREKIRLYSEGTWKRTLVRVAGDQELLAELAHRALCAGLPTPSRDLENHRDLLKMISFSSKWAFFFFPPIVSYDILKVSFRRTSQWRAMRYKQPWENEDGKWPGRKPGADASLRPSSVLQHFKINIKPLLLWQQSGKAQQSDRSLF